MAADTGLRLEDSTCHSASIAPRDSLGLGGRVCVWGGRCRGYRAVGW